jgi:Ser/Thr protein kinase RdoA (MazF antagonist)
MTNHGRFKQVVRRHAEETGQRYTEALSDLEQLQTRMFHQPTAERLLAHLQNRHGLDAVAAVQVSRHNDHVFRVDRRDGGPWIARVFPPARPRSGAEGDAAIMRFLARQGYPAERVPAGDAVYDFDGGAILLTEFIPGRPLPSPAAGAEGAEKFAVMGDLLGRLHALPADKSVSRPGGATGLDPAREGRPRQDLLAALSFLDAVDTKVAAAHRERFDQLRDQVHVADDGQGLPEALLHGNLLHAPDHVIVSEAGPVAINWKAAGRGPRLLDLAWLMWGTWRNRDWIDAAVRGYRRHVEPASEELDRLEAVMYVRPLFLMCFAYRRYLAQGHQPDGSEGDWGGIDPDYISATAAATRAAFGR